MDKRDDGGPAFPTSGTILTDAQCGMSLRDWMASQAMPVVVGLIGIPQDEPDELWNGAIAEQAYAIADSMIAHRNKDRTDER